MSSFIADRANVTNIFLNLALIFPLALMPDLGPAGPQVQGRAPVSGMGDGAERLWRVQGLEVLDLLDPIGPISFDVPLAEGAPEIVGRTLGEVVEHASPRHAPIEGLPEDLWKDQKCSSCHQWEREALCTQGNLYLSDTGAVSLMKLHPLGGSFKRTLKVWAEGGCQ